MPEISEFYGVSSRLLTFCIEEGCSLDGQSYRDDPVYLSRPSDPNNIKPSWK